MNHRVKPLAEQARRLSPEDRAELIDDLLASLGEPPDAWATAWLGEADRRWAQRTAAGDAACEAFAAVDDIEKRLERRRRK